MTVVAPLVDHASVLGWPVVMAPGVAVKLLITGAATGVVAVAVVEELDAFAAASTARTR